MNTKRPHVVIVGGGVAGLETLIGLTRIAPSLVDITLVSAQPEFVYRPLLVEEPFGLGPPEAREIAPIVADAGAEFVLGPMTEIDPAAKTIEVGDSTKLSYDMAVICIGARPRPALANAITFPGRTPLDIDALIERAGDGELAFVVPSGSTWSLPAYELALMTDRRCRELGRRPQIVVITAEPSPLAIFGSAPSAAVAETLAARGIEVRTGRTVCDCDDDCDDGSAPCLSIRPGDERYVPGAVVAMAALEGPGIPGLPAEPDGFIPTDAHSQVIGVEGVYAAGDGTAFPVKQGGLAAQQADAAIEHIAAAAGADLEPEPFRPVLRGTLLTGGESLNLEHGIAGGAGEGRASLDRLWWPPHKIGGRFLAPFLAHSQDQSWPDPGVSTIDVEVALPHEWHGDPLIAGSGQRLG